MLFFKLLVLDIIYWRDIKRSGIALTFSLFVLYSFSQYTILTLVAYIGLILLGLAIGLRLYKLGESQFKKTVGSNPFKIYLDQDVNDILNLSLMIA